MTKTVPFLGLALLVQIPLGFAVFISRSAMRLHWHEVLGGAALPTSTSLALAFGPVIPIVSIILLLALAVFCRKAERTPFLLGALIVLLLLEVLALGGYAYGIAKPPWHIMYRLGT